MGEEACSDRAIPCSRTGPKRITDTNTTKRPKVSSLTVNVVWVLLIWTLFGYGQTQFYYNRVLQGENAISATAFGNAISELDYVKTGFGNGTTSRQVKFMSTTQQLRVNNRVFTKTTSNTFSNTGYIIWLPSTCTSKPES